MDSNSDKAAEESPTRRTGSPPPLHAESSQLSPSHTPLPSASPQLSQTPNDAASPSPSQVPPVGSVKKATFQCAKCSYSCNFEFNLTSHMKTHKPGVPLVHCDVCDYAASNVRLLSRHKNTTHGMGNRKESKYYTYTLEPSRLRERNITPAEVKVEIQAVEDYNNCENTREFSPDVGCPDFKLTDIYSQGVKVEQPEDYYVPQPELASEMHHLKEENEYLYSRAGRRLRGHSIVKQKHDDPDYEESPQRRKRRKRGSGLVSPFSCTYCGKVFKYAASLSAHKKIHMVYKPYKCPKCSYRCNQSGALEKHIQSHKGSILHRCELCGFTTSNATGLTRHRNEEHAGQLSKLNANSQVITNLHNLTSENIEDIKPSDVVTVKMEVDNETDLSESFQLVSNYESASTSLERMTADGKPEIRVRFDPEKGRRVFHCPYCEKPFASRQNVQIHMRIHTGEKPYRCPHCTYACSQRGNLRSHLKSHRKRGCRVLVPSTLEKPSWYKCNLCQFATKNPAMLHAHNQIIHPDIDKQGQRGKQSSNVNVDEGCCTPLLHTSIKIKTEPGTYGCSACDEQFPEQSQYELHMMLKHARGKDEICNDDEDNPAGTPYHCNQCNFVSKLQIALKMHMKKHEPALSSRSYVKLEQLENMEDDEVIDPEVDPFATVDGADTQAAQVREETGRRLFCPLCMIPFTSEFLLDVHMQSHTKPPMARISCSECKFSTTNKELFDSHRETHNGNHYGTGRVYDPTRLTTVLHCKYCPKTFISPGEFANHIRTHTREKPYKCHLCSYSCIQQVNLKTHLKSHKQGVIFKCDRCDYTASNKMSLNVHFFRNHPKYKTGASVTTATTAVRSGLVASTTAPMSKALQPLQPKPMPLGGQTQAATNLVLIAQVLPNNNASSSNPPGSTILLRPNNIVSSKNNTATTTSQFIIATIPTNSQDSRVSSGLVLTNFTCNVCSKVFKTHPELTLHLRSHTGEKPFKCSLCSYSCTQQSNLNTHMRSHRDGVIYKCRWCPFTASNCKTLVVHQNREHQAPLVSTDVTPVVSQKSVLTFSPASVSTMINGAPTICPILSSSGVGSIVTGVRPTSIRPIVTTSSLTSMRPLTVSNLLRPVSTPGVVRPIGTTCIVRPASTTAIVRPTTSSNIVTSLTPIRIVRPSTSTTVLRPVTVTTVKSPVTALRPLTASTLVRPLSTTTAAPMVAKFTPILPKPYQVGANTVKVSPSAITLVPTDNSQIPNILKKQNGVQKPVPPKQIAVASAPADLDLSSAEIWKLEDDQSPASGEGDPDDWELVPLYPIGDQLYSTLEGNDAIKLPTSNKKDSNIASPSRTNAVKDALVRIQTSNKIKCFNCPQEFNSRSQLRQHSVIHNGEKPFKCHFCDYASNYKQSLQIHIRTHTGEKPYGCNKCNYKCVSSASLYIHRKTHQRDDGVCG